MTKTKLQYNLKLEQEILTGIFSLDPKKRLNILVGIKREYFYDTISQRVYNELIKDNGLDITVLTEKLKRVKVSRLVEWVSSKNYSGGNLDSRIDLLKDLYLRRELKKLSMNIEDSLESTDIVKVITSIDKTLLDITKNVGIESGKAGDVYQKYLEMKKDKEVIKYGLEKLDAVSNGHRKGQIWVLGGESGVGKSFFALNVLLRNVMREKRVLFFSTELMSAVLYERIIPMFVAESGMEDSEEAAESLADNQHLLLYDSLRKPENILTEIKRQKLIGGCDLVIIDHIQDIETDSKSDRVKELEGICNMFKDFAIKEKVAFFITSQLNDQGLFRDSRKVRHMATVALLLIGEKDQQGNYLDLKTLMIDKNRMGKMHGVIKIQMDRNCIFRQAKYEMS